MKEHSIYASYWGSKDGKVFSTKRQDSKELKQHHTGSKLQVKLHNKLVTVHRFIWECFNGTIPADYVIYHKDNDYTNNRLDNLGMRTKSEHQKMVMKKRWSSKG